MTNAERKMLLQKKRTQLAIYKTRYSSSTTKYVISRLLIFLFIIGTIVGGIAVGAYYAMALGVMLSIIGFGLLVAFTVASIVDNKRRSNAPYVIEKLTEEIETLTKELNQPNTSEEENEISNIENQKVGLLKEYKKLLDEGAITKEEYEDKKQQLLK